MNFKKEKERLRELYKLKRNNELYIKETLEPGIQNTVKDPVDWIDVSIYLKRYNEAIEEIKEINEEIKKISGETDDYIRMTVERYEDEIKKNYQKIAELKIFHSKIVDRPWHFTDTTNERILNLEHIIEKDLLNLNTFLNKI